jgi:hypothetical protein
MTQPSERKNDFEAFDQLPKPLRETLANANFKWATQDAVTAVKQGVSTFDIVKAIKQLDRSQPRMIDGPA